MVAVAGVPICWPGPQAVVVLHMRSLVAVPGIDAYWVGPHAVHIVHDVAFTVVLKPVAHGVQPRLVVALPVIPGVTFWPAGQFVSGLHETAFGVLLNEPAAHGAQVWLLVGVPATVIELPGWQTSHGMQTLALTIALYDDAGQALHVRSAVAEPATASVPAGQSVHATQLVAALASLSQVPAAQGVGAASLPAQYWPGAQALQLGGVLSVPGAVWRVPAAQAPWGKHIEVSGDVA